MANGARVRLDATTPRRYICPCAPSRSRSAVKKIDAKRIESRIGETLSHYFEGLRIVAVHVAQDLDQDGEEILLIDVVFEGDLNESDARRAAATARHLRPVLEENDADLYPLVSFVSKVDYERGHERRATH
jgi:hypothetical protein